jgi:ankyrin repeat protein
LAAIKGQLEIGKELVLKGADPNSRDFDESTPLHYASSNGQTTFITFLLVNAKADPLLKNKFGYQPSDIA